MYQNQENKKRQDNTENCVWKQRVYHQIKLLTKKSIDIFNLFKEKKIKITYYFITIIYL